MNDWLIDLKKLKHVTCFTSNLTTHAEVWVPDMKFPALNVEIFFSTKISVKYEKMNNEQG